MAERSRRASANTAYSNSGPSSSRPIVGGMQRHVRQSSVAFQNSLPTNFNNLGFVTGPPSRAHWKPDTSVAFCESCQVRFNLLTRRHHCRTCGGIFCGPCSKHIIRLDQNAEPHPAGVESRICEECHKEFARRAERARLDAAALISRGSSQKPRVAPRGGASGPQSDDVTASDVTDDGDDEDGDHEDDEEDEVELGSSAPKGTSSGGRAFAGRNDRRGSVEGEGDA
ncbi:UNVERIFIED_CONTAM: hypothetical protein HDU68_007547 [Siphonaria sp. JEL0065]|nr:hypothetical protein HDU68_007547 [Siphonaria sp. JEL0065]